MCGYCRLQPQICTSILNPLPICPHNQQVVRWGLTTASTLCFSPRNLIITNTWGYFWTSPCTHLTFTRRAVPNAMLWTMHWLIDKVWLQPKYSVVDTPWILLGMWYIPAQSGECYNTSRLWLNAPSFISWHWSWTWTSLGSLDHKHTGLDFTCCFGVIHLWGRRKRHRRGESPWVLETGFGGGRLLLPWCRDRMEKWRGRTRQRQKMRRGRVPACHRKCRQMYSASWIISSSIAGWGHWIHSTVHCGSLITNCSNTTTSMTSLAPHSSASNQQANQCCCGQRISIYCCSRVCPISCRMAHFSSEYSSRLAMDSCCVANWASLATSVRNQVVHRSAGHLHTSTTYSSTHLPWGLGEGDIGRAHGRHGWCCWGICWLNQDVAHLMIFLLGL